MLGVNTTVASALAVHLLVVEEVLHEASMLTSPAEQPTHLGLRGETPDLAAVQVIVIRLQEFVQVPAQVATAALAAWMKQTTP